VDKNRNDETQEREHAGDTTAAHPKTLDFSTRLEFSVATASCFVPNIANKIEIEPKIRLHAFAAGVSLLN
jgi:hypothetical protein